jgi:hypothetical protein
LTIFESLSGSWRAISVSPVRSSLAVELKIDGSVLPDDHASDVGDGLLAADSACLWRSAFSSDLKVASLLDQRTRPMQKTVTPKTKR